MSGGTLCPSVFIDKRPRNLLEESIVLEALNGQALNVHRAKLLMCSLMQPLCTAEADGNGESISTRQDTTARAREREAKSYMRLKYEQHLMRMTSG